MGASFSQNYCVLQCSPKMQLGLGVIFGSTTYYYCTTVCPSEFCCYRYILYVDISFISQPITVYLLLIDNILLKLSWWLGRLQTRFVLGVLSRTAKCLRGITHNRTIINILWVLLISLLIYWLFVNFLLWINESESLLVGTDMCYWFFRFVEWSTAKWEPSRTCVTSSIWHVGRTQRITLSYIKDVAMVSGLHLGSICNYSLTSMRGAFI